jgi:adenylosuccinate synthase
MPVIAVIGGHWGDEGKGKIVDLLAEKVNIVVRFSGGDNAGHTVVNRFGLFKLHLMPSGIFSPKTISIIGNGVVINPEVLLAEIDDLQKRGVDTSRLIISDRAHLVMPYHLLLDGLEEEQRGGKAIGTTKKGIGPAFADKIARLGIRAGDLLDKEAFRERLHSIMTLKNAILSKVYGVSPLSEEDVYRSYCRYAERLVPYIRETTEILESAIARGEKILLEGAQGTLLDPDFGTYPYVTSSSPLSGGGCVGTGIAPRHITTVLSVFKAYCTRVGGGPMPTELKDKTGELIRKRGNEFGTTTGRPRRCGWFDAVAARFSTRINGYTHSAITRLDVLDELPEVKICVAYQLNGKKIDSFPANSALLERCQPVYEALPGWQTSTNNVRRYEDLPRQAQKYLSRIEELTACPIAIISVGQAREETIIKIPVV